MRFARFSIADLLVAVGICAVGLACLKLASSVAGGVLSVTLGFLTVAGLGVIYRQGERRAFWAGVLICGWAYMALSSGPWFIDHVRPRLVTSALLDWSYPRLIPAERQASHPSAWTVAGAVLEGGLIRQDLRRSPVDVWVKGNGAASPSLLVEGIAVITVFNVDPQIPGVGVSLSASPDQFAKLENAKAASQQFILRPHVLGVFDRLWFDPRVDLSDFESVGHSLFGLLFAWVGGIVGRYFFATRGPDATSTGDVGSVERD
jgi:hypothetical protein